MSSTRTLDGQTALASLGLEQRNERLLLEHARADLAHAVLRGEVALAAEDEDRARTVDVALEV